MQPATEYVPEVRKSRPTWKSNKKLPNYGPVIDEPHRPRHFFDDSAKSYTTKKYNIANLSTPQHPSQSSPMNLMYWIQSNPTRTRSSHKHNLLLESLCIFMIHTTTKVSPQENGTKGSSRGSPISATSATLSINSGMMSRKQHPTTINHPMKTLSPYCNPNLSRYQMKALGSMLKS
jgi:hypothetical protein